MHADLFQGCETTGAVFQKHIIQIGIVDTHTCLNEKAP